MADGLYIAGAGMVSRQARQDAVSENVANISTPGFKASRVFSEVLGEVQASAAALQDVSHAQKTYTDFSQGAIEPTGRDLDVAIEGEGFFVISTPQGERYTRGGGFTLDPEGRLVDAGGDPVLTDAGPITLDGGKLGIDAGGQLSVDGRSVGKLQIAAFAVPGDELVRDSHGRFAPRAGATPGPAPEATRLRQGSLERSNVEGVDEMVRMMTLLRQYEASQRIFKLQSEALGRVVNELVQR